VDFRRVRRFFSLKGACLVMERVEGQSLAQFSDYSLPQAIRLFQDVCRALSYIHSRGLVHADMKPQNILVGDELRVKLIDFGFAAPIGSKLRGLKGTWGYLAPEQAGGELDVRTDVFNLGAVMFWVFTGENIPTIIPNDRSSGGYVPSAPFRMKAPVHFNSDMPMEISDLIVLCCKRDPLKRPTMQWVRQRLANVALRHELKLNEQPEP
jgi:serine/threonine-protein kinase